MESATFSPRAKSKKKLVCALIRFSNAFNKDMEIRFHYFWMKTNFTVHIENLFRRAEKRNQLQISRHFRADDYILPTKFFSHLD